MTVQDFVDGAVESVQAVLPDGWTASGRIKDDGSLWVSVTVTDGIVYATIDAPVDTIIAGREAWDLILAQQAVGLARVARSEPVPA